MTEATPALDFDDFYAATAQRLVRQFYALTGDLGDAQDIAQEAYARAWQHWSRIARYDSPESWVRTIGFRLANNRWRKAQNAVTAWRRHGPPPQPAEIKPDVMLLVAALRTLPERQRVAIVLYHIADLPIGEVADRMGIPSGTVKALLSRGRKALAAQLADPARAAALPPSRNETP